MDQNKFNEAQAAYDSGDFRGAAKLFLAAAADTGVVGNGAAYHMAGNSLMRLRRYPDASTVYGHALRDDTYDRRGALYVNLGQALCSMGEYAEAGNAFESALAEPSYPTPFKALQGLAGSLMERGKVEQAAVAYRKAAIDPENPNPGKALVNLGLCFMGLARPSDAVEAYKAALGSESYKGRGKALANLGIAYVQLGEYGEAVRAFENATQVHGYTLSGSARDAYERAATLAKPAPERVDGWETGELPPAVAADLGATGWATGELAALDTEAGFVTGISVPAPAFGGQDADAAARELGIGDAEAVTDFFNRTEDDMRKRDRAEQRSRRTAEQSRITLWRRILVWSAAAVVLLGGLAIAFGLGYGWPPQELVVERLLDAYRLGDDTTKHWAVSSEKDVAKEMAKIPPLESYSISEVERDSWTSVVSVTVTPEKGAPLQYRVTLGREGVGWRVTGIDNDWRSTGS